MKQLLNSERLLLRALEPEDLVFFYNIENDTSLWSSSNTTVPYSKFLLKYYLENTKGDLFSDKELRLVVECKETRQPIGMIDLYDFNAFHHRAEVGVVILEEYRGKGYGSEALDLLVNYVFRFLMLHQLYAYVDSKNESSMALFSKVGFKQVSVLKDWFYDINGFRDAVVYQIFNCSKD